MNEDRIINLESKLSYQEDLIRELSEVIARQDKSLYQLEQSVGSLGQQFKELSENAQGGSANEKPPHY